MQEQQQHSRVSCGLGILKETLFCPSSPSNDGKPDEDDLTFESRELRDVCSLSEDESSLTITDATEVFGPCGEFGSDPCLHGKVLCEEHFTCGRKAKQLDFERPQPRSTPRPVAEGHWDPPIRSTGEGNLSLTESDVHRRLQKERSFSTDFCRDEAWERKRDLYHATYEPGDGRRVIGRSVSDCTNRGSAEKPRLRTTLRSLTDEDLEELRGCIDLGFGFSDDESSCGLKSTFPALELYYAINRHYADVTSRSSPVSPLDRTSSGESPYSSLGDSWRISSPGDHPSRVKVRLRHWAQAVACSIKQGFSP